MNTSMSIRDLTRRVKKLAEYDYIDIEDKKSHEYKGVFVSSRYADEVKRFLEKKLADEKRKRLNQLMQFSGIADGETNNKTIQELKADKEKRYMVNSKPTKQKQVDDK